nr:aldo/keto reductase [Halococcus sp. IIIV-5B]
MTTFPRPLEIGLGTGSLQGEMCRNTVEQALDIGYRHIDTAQIYGNESDIGDALRSAKVNKESTFVATKLHSKNLGHEDVLASAKHSRDRLSVEAIDLLYIHWPAHTYDPYETMAAFDLLRERDVIKRIGVSNFTCELLTEAHAATTHSVFANQIEMHPFLQQKPLQKYAVENDIILVAHTPFAGGAVFNDPTLRSVANDYDSSIAQITLAWLLEKENVAVIPRSRGPHLKENHTASNLSLTEDTIRTIDSIDREVRVVDYEFAPWN